MTQESTQVLDAEDQMAAALQEIRNERESAPVAETPAEPTPVVSEAAAAEPTPATEAPAEAQATQPDPANDLKQIQVELQKARSEIGRVNALNHKYQQAAQEVAQLREQLAQARQSSQPQPASTSESAQKLAQIAEQVKDFPELAGIVSAVSGALQEADRKAEEVARKAAAQVIQPLEPLRRDTEARVAQEQKAAFDAALTQFNEVYPTAAEVVQSADFNAWLATQPGHIQYAFNNGQTPQEAMSVMDSYDMHLRRNGLNPIAQIKTQQTQTPQPAASAQNRLQRAAGLPSRPTGSTGGQPPADDFDAALAYFRQQRLSRLRAAA